MGDHLAQLLRQWSADVVLLLHSAPLPEPDQAAGLAARGIPVVRSPVVQVEVADDRLTGVRLADGSFLARDVLFCAPVLTARTAGLTGLDLTIAEDPRGFGLMIATDSAGRDRAPGVWAAGNVRNVQAQVGASVADGTAVAAASTQTWWSTTSGGLSPIRKPTMRQRTGDACMTDFPDDLDLPGT